MFTNLLLYPFQTVFDSHKFPAKYVRFPLNVSSCVYGFGTTGDSKFKNTIGKYQASGFQFYITCIERTVTPRRNPSVT